MKNLVLNRISTFAEYEKKMNDYKNHIKLMIGKASLFRST